jgi:hypothetical protein
VITPHARTTLCKGAKKPLLPPSLTRFCIRSLAAAREEGRAMRFRVFLRGGGREEGTYVPSLTVRAKAVCIDVEPAKIQSVPRAAYAP